MNVTKQANQIHIRKRLAEIFKVKVSAVNVMRYDGKEKRMGLHSGKRPSYKKAVVTLAADSKTIEFFDNLM